MCNGCEELLTIEYILLTCSGLTETERDTLQLNHCVCCFRIFHLRRFLTFPKNQYFWKHLNLRPLLVVSVSHSPFKYGFKIVHIPVLTRKHF